MTKMAFGGMGGPRGGMGGPRGGMGGMGGPRGGMGGMGGFRGGMGGMGGMGVPRGGMPAPQALPSRGIGQTGGERPPQIPQPMKKGGKVSSASSRADGCAVRGKTKGKMI